MDDGWRLPVRVNPTRGATVLCVACSLLVAGAARGFSPPDREAGLRSTYAGPGVSFLPPPVRPKIPAGERIGEWREFTSRYGQGWQVRWNDATGTPARILGSRIPTGLGEDSPPKAVETWAREFVGRNRTLLGVSSGDLVLLDLREADGRRHVAFQQLQDGIPVYGGILKLVINRDGDLVLIANGCHPAVKYAPIAKLSPAEAARRAAARIAGRDPKAPAGKSAVKQSGKIIFPVAEGDGVGYRLCYRLVIHLDDPLGDWVVITDAADGRDYARYNNYRFGSVAGEVTGEILPAYYDDVPVSVPFEDESVHAFLPTMVYRWDMSVNPGWTAQGLWAWGTPNGYGGDQGDSGPTAGHTGSSVYGYNLYGGYGDDLASAQYLTTTSLNCSSVSGAHLSFWQWLGIEGSAYDRVSLEVSNDGTNWTQVWENWYATTRTSDGWERVVYDISAVADGRPSVFIRWGLGPTDYSWTYAGWYLDDVEIYGGGGTDEVSATGDYAIAYSGGGPATVFAQLSGPYQDVYYEDGNRLSFTKDVASAVQDWSWSIPELTPIYSWNLDTNPGWSVQGAWAWGIPSGIAGDPTGGHTGSRVYGYNLAGAYPNDMGSAQYLTTSAINCSTLRSTHLRFWRWLGVEAGVYDSASIEVSNDGSHWSTVYVNPPYSTIRDEAWTQVQYNISDLADGHPTVYVRWGMGPTDFSVTYGGWNIDDVEIVADQTVSDLSVELYDFDETNVFHHLTVARKSIKAIEPGFTGMDYQVPAVVRIGTFYANAFWDGRGVNFGEGDGAYFRNLALFADVIYHEFQHGVTHQIYPDTMLPYTGESGALDEAWSDFFSCDITDEPMVGEGDLVIGEPFMRNLDNILRVPDDWAGEVHDDGRIAGGAMWDLRQSLGASLAAHLLHFARYGLAETFLDYYEDVLVADDDNANLFDGTPHMVEIAQAFGTHGIGGIRLLGLDHEVTSEVIANGKLDAGETGNLVTTVMAHFLAGNVGVTLTSSDPYVSIPDGSAEFGDLAYGEEQDNATDPLTIAIDPDCPEDEILEMNLNFTANGGYAAGRELVLINAPTQIVYDAGQPQGYFGYGLEGGGFAVRFTPPFYPITITSVRLWPSPWSGDVEIELHAWDDDGPGGSPGTDLILPRKVALEGSDSWEQISLAQPTLEVAYQWNMDTNPGWSAGSGWAWGTPTGQGGDPTSGYTGTRVFGYNLSGQYENNLSAPRHLRTSAINCSGMFGVHLRFMRWLGIEDAVFDHASIEVSNNGTTWVPVWEHTGGTVSSPTWEQVTYDISAVADGRSTVYIRWGMGPTDSSVTYCGWNIDDVAILRTTGVSPGITVSSGDFYLGWVEGSEIYYNGRGPGDPDNRTWVYDLDLGQWRELAAMGFPLSLLVRARFLLAPTSVENWTSYR